MCPVPRAAGAGPAGLRGARALFLCASAGLILCLPPTVRAAGSGGEDLQALAAEAREAVDRATTFFVSISTRGGWAGIYSPDLEHRWGEALYERCRPNEIWVQPPGTPSVGKVLLRAYRVTGERRFLSAARDAGRALVWGQREAGGWDHRADVSHLTPEATVPRRRKGPCTLDDNITQGATDFLMDLDRTLDEPWLDDGVRRALGFLLESQFPNGAWPQWYPLRGGYHDYWTFNDGAINDCIRVLLAAHRQYGRPEFLAAARRGGEFVVASRLPPPQAGWAQQYDHRLRPAWARAFEPPAVCSAVTARNIRTLVDLAVYTRDARFLEPIPAALAWLDRSRLPDGRWARFYELGTNRPIYGDRDGKVHYTLEELSEERRTGYSWQGEYGVAAARAYYEKVRRAGPAAYAEQMAERARRRPSPEAAARRARALAPRVRAIIDALDAKGRWIDADGRIRSATFVEWMRVLCDFLEAVGAATAAADRPGR